MLYTFIELNGAMRSTQLPHLVALEGMITTSTSMIPAPLISPLIVGPDDDKEGNRQKEYHKQLEGIVQALNGTDEQQTVQANAFTSVSEFAAQMRNLIDSTSPFKMAVGASR